MKRILTLAASVCLACSAQSVVAQTTTTTPSTTTTAPSTSQYNPQSQQNQSQSNSAGGQNALSAQTQQGLKISILTPSPGSGTANGVPSTSNSFVAAYGDPMSLGMPSKWAKGPPNQQQMTFGTGLYTTTKGSTTTQGGATAANTQAHGFTTYGTVRNPAYATALSDDLPLVVHEAPALQSAVRSVIDRSSYIKTKASINVNVANGIVELTGVVGTDRERRLVEGMVRMTPGVRDVQNNLQVPASK